MNITYNDFNFICRLCLTKNDAYTCVLQGNVVKLLDDLGVRIDVKKLEELPQQICSQCEKNIESIFIFISRCKSSYELLSSILLHEKKIKNEIKVYDDSSCINYHGHKQEIDVINKHNEFESGDIPDNILLKKINIDDATNPKTDAKKFGLRKAEIICKTCNLSCKSKTYLSTHYKKNIECRPLNFRLYKCDYCSKEFLTLRDKSEHENVHTGETPYNCPYCLQVFKFKTNLNRHIYRHKRKLGLVETKAAYTEKRVRLKLRCDKCEKVFASRSGFQRHKLKHEGKVVPKKGEAKLDKNIKHFLCNYCAMSFYIKANLDAHLRVHTGERPYKCSHCDQQFKQKSVLDRHTLSHLDVRPKPFVCDICQKCFTTKAHMNIHKRLHTGEKPYECNFCQKCFNYRTRWRIHLRMHTGESPFVCTVCYSSYYDKGSLRKHQRKKGHINKEDSKNVSTNLTNLKNELDKQVVKSREVQKENS